MGRMYIGKYEPRRVYLEARSRPAGAEVKLQ